MSFIAPTAPTAPTVTTATQKKQRLSVPRSQVLNIVMGSDQEFNPTLGNTSGKRKLQSRQNQPQQPQQPQQMQQSSQSQHSQSQQHLQSELHQPMQSQSPKQSPASSQQHSQSELHQSMQSQPLKQSPASSQQHSQNELHQSMQSSKSYQQQPQQNQQSHQNQQSQKSQQNQQSQKSQQKSSPEEEEAADSMAIELIQEMMPVINFKSSIDKFFENESIIFTPKDELNFSSLPVSILVQLRFMYNVSELIDGAHDMTFLNPNAYDIWALKQYYIGNYHNLKDLVHECKILDFDQSDVRRELPIKLSFLSTDKRFNILRGHEIMSSMTLKVMELYSTIDKSLGIDWVNITIGDRGGVNDLIHFGTDTLNKSKEIFTKAIMSLKQKIQNGNLSDIMPVIKSTSEAGRKAGGVGGLTETVLENFIPDDETKFILDNAFKKGKKMENSYSLFYTLDRGPGPPTLRLPEWCNITLDVNKNKLFNTVACAEFDNVRNREFTLFITDTIIIKAHVYVFGNGIDCKLRIYIAIYRNDEGDDMNTNISLGSRGKTGKLKHYINVELLSNRGISVDAIICEVRKKFGHLITDEQNTYGFSTWGQYRGDELVDQDDFKVIGYGSRDNMDVMRKYTGGTFNNMNRVVIGDVFGSANIAVMLLRYLKTLGDHVWGVGLGEGDKLNESSYCKGQLLCTTCDTWLKHVQFHKYSLGYIYSAEMFVESISKGGNWRIRSYPITDNNLMYSIKKALAIAYGFYSYDIAKYNKCEAQNVWDAGVSNVLDILFPENLDDTEPINEHGEGVNYHTFLYEAGKVTKHLKKLSFTTT